MIPQEDALRLQLAMIAGDEPLASCFELRGLKGGKVVERRFIRVYGIRRVMREVERMAPHVDVYVGCAPRIGWTSGTLRDIERVWCLWADCDTAQANEHLRRFRPRPSLVNASGGEDRSQAWWQLSRPLSTAGADRANRRLARALGADKTYDATRVLRPVGSINHKYGRTVRCVHLELVAFRPHEIIGGLEDDDRYAPRPRRPQRRHRTPGTEGLLQTVAEAQNGNRNNTLFWAACRAAEEGTLGDIRDELEDAALSAGLDAANVQSTLRSAERRAA
jgi:hypothetical protein